MIPLGLVFPLFDVNFKRKVCRGWKKQLIYVEACHDTKPKKYLHYFRFRLFLGCVLAPKPESVRLFVCLGAWSVVGQFLSSFLKESPGLGIFIDINIKNEIYPKNEDNPNKDDLKIKVNLKMKKPQNKDYIKNAAKRTRQHAVKNKGGGTHQQCYQMY